MKKSERELKINENIKKLTWRRNQKCLRDEILTNLKDTIWMTFDKQAFHCFASLPLHFSVGGSSTWTKRGQMC